MSLHKHCWLFVILALLLGLTGCGSKTKTPVLTSISISPPSAKVPIGGKQQFTAVAKDQNGKEMDGITFAWTVDQKEIGEIDKNGVFTGK